MTVEQAEGAAVESNNAQSESVEVEQTDTQAQEDTSEQESAGESPEQAETAAPAEQEDEVVISIGEEPPPPKDEPAPAWVKELRKTNRELARRNKELEARLTTTAAPPPVVVGKKPTLEDAGYDADKFEKDLASWYERKRKADEVEAQARTEQERQQKEWQSRLETYNKAKAEFRVSDYEEAEHAFSDTFSQLQQVAILHAAENPHHLVYALGKNPKKAKELAAITDPAKFAYAAGKLEAQLKVQSKKPAAAPEKPVSGTGRVSGATDTTLERLRAEAEKTGNYSKVIAYKNSKRGK